MWNFTIFWIVVNRRIKATKFELIKNNNDEFLYIGGNFILTLSRSKIKFYYKSCEYEQFRASNFKIRKSH